ncbi:MAG: response regulator transcription factor [Acidimicrobiia bacterium]
MLNVLIVEDEPSYVEALQVTLEVEGFHVSAALDGRTALVQFRSSRPDVILLDLMLPGLSGLDVLRRIRAESETPVIVVSAKDTESDIVTALELGADDYLTKPYSARELVARIRATMRRGAAEEDETVLTAGNAVLDPGRYALRLENTPFDLPKKEFELMHLLMERAGRVVPRGVLLEEIWGAYWEDSKTLDQHIRRLRRKLEQVDDSPRITTVRGVGYRLDP